MSHLVGNPEDWFSHDAAQIIKFSESNQYMYGIFGDPFNKQLFTKRWQTFKILIESVFKMGGHQNSFEIYSSLKHEYWVQIFHNLYAF